jgi:hypothetical protein
MVPSGNSGIVESSGYRARSLDKYILDNWHEKTEKPRSSMVKTG